jgi:hypothetical protein
MHAINLSYHVEDQCTTVACGLHGKIPKLTGGLTGQRDRRSQVKLSYGVLGLGNEDFSSGRGAHGVARGEPENVV